MRAKRARTPRRTSLNPAPDDLKPWVPVQHTPAQTALNSVRHGLLRQRAVARDFQCTSFQNSFFISQASQVNTSRNSTTQTPRERRAACAGSPT
jgi:hypothetical protein